MCDLSCSWNKALNHILYTIQLTFLQPLLDAFLIQYVQSMLLSKREGEFLRAAQNGDQITIAALLAVNTRIDLTDEVSIIISMIIKEDQDW
jgi:hypothetical protein